MKDWILGFGLLTVASMSWAWVTTAQANENNNTMKWCLEQTGYKVENFNTFNFSKAAACHSDYRIGKKKAEYTKMREFLKDHPWYKGTDWQWETRAEYKCTKRVDLGGIEVCHKPYYLN